MGVGAGLSMYVVVVQKFTFAISSPDEFLFTQCQSTEGYVHSETTHFSGRVEQSVCVCVCVCLANNSNDVTSDLDL